jgi:hypothetical protein
MKDNFGRGIYPTLQQRQEFARTLCDYVEQQMAEATTSPPSGKERPNIVLATFSFVNSDLRQSFRAHFPNAHWVLLNTSKEEAQRRVDHRIGHFYKGKKTDDSVEAGRMQRDSEKRNVDDLENSLWEFASVTFPHVQLDGDDAVDSSSRQLANILRVLSGAGPIQ